MYLLPFTKVFEFDFFSLFKFSSRKYMELFCAFAVRATIVSLREKDSKRFKI